MNLPPMKLGFDTLGQASDYQEEQPAGLRCELKIYESRYNSRGERLTLQVGSGQRDTSGKGEAHDSAFVLTRIYDKFRELENTQLDIRSPFVKKALQEVIVQYPGIDFHAKIIVILGPPKCIFHYRKELQAYGTTLKDETAAEHLMYLLEYMYKLFASEVATWDNFMESPIIPPRMDFNGLWMAFRPGEEVYTKDIDTEQVLRLKSIYRCECENPFCPNSSWTIIAQMISFDGDMYGYLSRKFHIQKYDGFLGLEQLNIFPFQYHPNKSKVRRELIERGRKFVALQGVHHRFYNGTAQVLSQFRVLNRWDDEEDFPTQTTHVEGRVMIDVKSFATEIPSKAISLAETLDRENYESRDASIKLEDEELLVCSHLTPGFCFTSKRWCIFRVALIEEIDFNTAAFEALVLPKHQKEMIHSLVKVHTSDSLGFDDLIRGKGKGMVFLFHGVPGTGKTLTAEGVADYTQRPLYTVSCGELGISINDVEERLCKALGLAENWNAIVLIDEADIFLEARSVNDLKRNGLVSIFLRLLEYYEGIMILTTNRVNVFDPAIKSRIHLAIKYHPLTVQSRRDLWRVFVTSACSGTSPEWLTDACLDRLAAEVLNGRQIKNTIRTAHALAASEQCELLEKHFEQSLNAMSMFERDFGEVEADVDDGGDYDGDSERIGFESRKRRRLF